MTFSACEPGGASSSRRCTRSRAARAACASSHASSSSSSDRTKAFITHLAPRLEACDHKYMYKLRCTQLNILHVCTCHSHQAVDCKQYNAPEIATCQSKLNTLPGLRCTVQVLSPQTRSGMDKTNVSVMLLQYILQTKLCTMIQMGDKKK